VQAIQLLHYYYSYLSSSVVFIFGKASRDAFGRHIFVAGTSAILIRLLFDRRFVTILVDDFISRWSCLCLHDDSSVKLRTTSFKVVLAPFCSFCSRLLAQSIQ